MSSKYSVKELTEFMFADLFRREREKAPQAAVLIEDRPLLSKKRKYDEVDWIEADQDFPRPVPHNPRQWMVRYGDPIPLLPAPLDLAPAWTREVYCRVAEFQGRERGVWSHSNFRNHHPRLDRIKFYGGFEQPEVHYYEIDGRKDGYEGCTTHLHHYFPDFEAKREEVATLCLNGRFNKAGRYYGFENTEQVLDYWDKVRDNGTCRHAAMDDWLQGRPMRQPHYQTGKSDCITGPPAGFFKFLLDFPALQPYFTEFSLFHMTWLICGQFDALFWDEERQCFILVDWKNCLNFRVTGIEMGIHPLTQHLESCHLVQYTMQLNIYTAILEACYGIKVEEMWIVNFPPLEESKAVYQRFVAKRWDMRPFFALCPASEEGKQRLLESGPEPIPVT